MAQDNYFSLADKLRLDTREAHRALEQLAFNRRLVAATLPLPAYVAQLQAYYTVFEVLEARCARGERLNGPWRADMSKLPLLAADLAFLGHSPGELPPLEETREFADYLTSAKETEIMGALYVLEGSTLGAGLLLPRLQAAFDLWEQGCAYYRAYGEQTRHHWQAFRERLNALPLAPGEREEVIAGAQQTFMAVGRILRALGNKHEL